MALTNDFKIKNGLTVIDSISAGGNLSAVDINASGEILSGGTDISEIFTTCVGDVTGIDAGTAITITDGGTATPTVSVTSACNTAWNAKTTCTGTLTAVCAGTNLTGGGTGNCVTLNMATGGAGSGTYGSTSNATKIDTITLDAYGRVTAVACGPTGDIDAVTTGPYLTGGGTSGSVEVGIDSACASKWDTAAAGDISAVTATGGLSGGGTSGDVCVGIDATTAAAFSCQGTVTSIATTGGITGGTITSSGTLSIASACNTKWDQSGCPGICCQGDITAVTAGSQMTGGATTGAATLNVSLSTGGAGSGTYGSTADNCKIDTITLDEFGRVTAVACGPTGDIAGVTAGSQMTGGGTSGTPTLNVSLSTGGIGSGTYGSTSDSTKIDQITVDEFGRVTNITTGATGSSCTNGTVTSIATGTGLTGGTITTSGTLSVDSTVARTNVDEVFSCDVTINGDLTVNGDITCLETIVSTTSALSVVNHGSGPAITVNQTGSNDIVDFRDDGTSVFYIEDGGFVGLNCTNPTQRLDVNGGINVTGEYKMDGSNVINSGGCFVGTGIALVDNEVANFGTSCDLKIYHNGNSIIEDGGAGSLLIRTDSFCVQNASGTETMIKATQNDAVALYYDNGGKFYTTSTGVCANGNIAVTGTVDGRDIAADGLKLDSAYTTTATLSTCSGLACTGDITGVTAGSQMTGGATSGNATLNVSLSTGGIGSGTYGSTADGTKIDTITVDEFGRVTAVACGATGTGDIAGATLTGGLSGSSLTSGTMCIGIDATTAAAFSCQGTVTCVDGGNGLTGAVTTSGSLAVGAGTGICVTANAVCVATACNTAWNGVYSTVQANSATWDNVGDITEIVAGSQMTGGGASGCVTLNTSLSTGGIGSGTYGSTADGTKIDTITVDEFGRVTAVACGPTGDISEVVAGTNLTGGGTAGCVTINMATGGIGSGTYGSTADNTKIDTITVDAYGRVTAVACGSTGDIAGATLTGGLSGSSLTSGTMCIGIDAATAASLNQAGCPGINCTGTTTASNTQTFTNKSGNISQWTNDSGYTTCLGDVTGIDAGTAITITDGATATPTVSVTSACNTAWNAKTTCLGTVTSVGGGDGLTGTVTTSGNLAVDSTVARTNVDETFSCDVTINGDLTVNGDIVCLETIVSTTSALSVVNNGSGPAITVNQTGTNDIVDFRDDNTSVFYIEDGGFVGLNCTNPVQRLDANGNINTSGDYRVDNNVVINTGRCFTGVAVQPTTDIADAYIASAATWNAKTTCLGTVTSIATSTGLTGGTITSSGTLSIDSTCNTTWNSAYVTTKALSGCAGLACVGDVTGIDAGTAITITDGATATPTVSVTSACNTAWNAKTTCLGTVTSVSGGTGISSSGGTTPSISLNEATATTRGGIELFSNTDQSVAANSVTSTAGRTYGLQLNSAGQAVVNVPWTDTNSGGTVTSIATGNGISGGTITTSGTLTVGAGTGLTQTSTGLCVSTACNTAWNAKTTCTGTVTSIATGNGIDGGTITGSGTLTVTAGTGLTQTSTGLCVSTACNTAWNAKTTCTGTFSSATAGLSGSGANVGINSGTLTPFDQSGCPGINCVGDVTGIDAGTAITITDGATATPTVSVTSACNTAWNAKTTCTGTVTSVSGGTGLTGTVTSSGSLAIDTGVVMDLTSAQTASGTKNFSGDICVGDQIFHTGDSDTYLRFGANAFCVYAGNEQHILANTSGVVINEGGLANDFRVESDTNTHMLFVDGSANAIGINCSTPGATLAVNGSFTATCKSFLIDNPVTGGQLKYGVVEGNEHGVTVRGTTCCRTIELPEEWDWLVHEDSVTVQLTPVGAAHTPYVVCQNNKEVVVCTHGCYNYNIYGTRKDVEPLEVNIL